MMFGVKGICRHLSLHTASTDLWLRAGLSVKVLLAVRRILSAKSCVVQRLACWCVAHSLLTPQHRAKLMIH
jgi:hypothetical protein